MRWSLLASPPRRTGGAQTRGGLRSSYQRLQPRDFGAFIASYIASILFALLASTAFALFPLGHRFENVLSELGMGGLLERGTYRRASQEFAMMSGPWRCWHWQPAAACDHEEALAARGSAVRAVVNVPANYLIARLQQLACHRGVVLLECRAELEHVLHDDIRGAQELHGVA